MAEWFCLLHADWWGLHLEIRDDSGPGDEGLHVAGQFKAHDGGQFGRVVQDALPAH